MASEWQTLTVDQIKAKHDRAIAIGPFGSRMKADTYVESGVPVIRGNNISDTRVFVDEFVYVSEQTADELKACNVFAGDLVFPHRGAIGQVGIIPATDTPRFMLSTSLMKLSCNREIVDPLFVFYFFRSTLGRHALLQYASTVGTPGIGQPLTSLRSIRLPVPPISEQRAIAHILGTLDDKIELNRRRNQTLEAMARALFKDWFVDFGPVRAKMEGREPYLPADIWQLFPDRLDDEGKPEGWGYFPFGELLEGTIGGDWGKESAEDDHEHPVCIIRGTDIPDLASGSTGKVPTRYTTKKKLASRILRTGDIVVEVSGGSPTQPTGRSLQVSQSILERFKHPVVCASFCRRFRPKNRELGLLAACHLTNLYQTGGTWEYQNQSTGISNFQTAHFLEAENVLLPSQGILESFARLVEPVLTKTTNNESITLAQVRDALLPRLISGDLRIADAERFLKERDL